MSAHARALSRSFCRRRQLISELISQPVPRRSAYFSLSCSHGSTRTLILIGKTPRRALYRLVSRCQGHESSCHAAATTRPPRVSVFALLIGPRQRDSAAVCRSRWPFVLLKARPNEGGVGMGDRVFFCVLAHLQERAVKVSRRGRVSLTPNQKWKRRRITLM